MFESKGRRYIDDLPEAMFEEALRKYEDNVFKEVNSYLVKISEFKEKIRDKLYDLGILKNFGEIVRYKRYPTTCGVDGAYAINKQLTMDVVAIAGVAVEGLVPPKEERIWEKPHHLIEIFPVEHSDRTPSVCRGLMFSFELALANKAPHSIVFLDGSLTSQLIALGMAFSAIEKGEIPYSLAEKFENNAEKTLQNYIKILKSEKSDQIFAGVPKYSSRHEVASKLMEFPELKGYIDLERYNDKALLSLVLKPDEVVGPIQLKEEGKWHLSGVKGKYEDYEKEIRSLLENLYIVYYKPSPSQPALRIEISRSVALNNARLAILLEGLQDQSKFAGIIEPYPLFLADMFVKHLSGALSEIKDIVISDIGSLRNLYSLDIFLAMHEYRSVDGYE